jgi:hypothetical protein
MRRIYKSGATKRTKRQKREKEAAKQKKFSTFIFEPQFYNNNN